MEISSLMPGTASAYTVSRWPWSCSPEFLLYCSALCWWLQPSAPSSATRPSDWHKTEV